MCPLQSLSVSPSKHIHDPKEKFGIDIWWLKLHEKHWISWNYNFLHENNKKDLVNTHDSTLPWTKVVQDNNMWNTSELCFIQHGWTACDWWQWPTNDDSSAIIEWSTNGSHQVIFQSCCSCTKGSRQFPI